MRKKKALLFTTIFLIVLGVAAILVGVFAYQLGLDNNSVMGDKRKILVGLGVFFLLLRPAWMGLEHLVRRCGVAAKIHTFNARLEQSRFASWLHSREQSRFNQFMRRYTWIWAVLASLIIIVTTIWYLTAGTFTQWTPYSRYFDRQADAFLAGQLALLEQPPAELAQVKDIYNWKAREGISYLWDATYYHGKYYIYWGPVPALVAASIKLIHPGVVEDQVLVLIFICGLGITLAALFHWLHKTYFPSAPGWMILLFTLTIVFCVPVFWLVNRPSVYEAAIASAQFFLILGVYAVMRGITGKSKKWGWLALAGFSFGASVASRFSYVFAVILMGLVIAVVLLKGFRKKGWKIAPLLGFGIPLVLIAAGLAWYNYARFGSILESGMDYALTGDQLPANRSLLFSLGYFVPNAYSSLLRPLQFTPGQFPFFATPNILDNMWPNFVHRPPTYFSGEQVAGILVTIPFLWMLGIILIKWISSLLDWITEKPQTASSLAGDRFPIWAIWLIAVGALTQFIALMSFVMATMRYLADLVPLFVLSAGLLVWNAYGRLSSRPGWRKALTVLTLLMCVGTIGMGLLTNMQGADRRFENNNPVLYNEIANFFTGISK